MQARNKLRVARLPALAPLVGQAPPASGHARFRITIGLLTVFLFGIFSTYLTIPVALATEASDYEASHPGEQVYFFLNDNLGSVDTVLDDKGNIVEQRDFLPYGSERVGDPADPSSTTHHKFTGKEMDEETGLYYYGARYYDPVIGRFISRDPFLAQLDRMSLQERNKFLSDPQNLNAYAYARNNPLKYVDPDGQFAILLALPAAETIAEGAMAAVMALTTILHDIPAFTPTPIPANTTPPKAVVSDPVPAQGKTEPLVIPTYVNPYPNNTASPVLPQTKLEPLIFPSSQGTGGICGVNMSCESGDDAMNPHEFPLVGIPNSTRLKWENGGIKKGRTYDDEGKVSKDYHNSDHGNPKAHTNPHEHDWRTNPDTGKSERIN